MHEQDVELEAQIKRILRRIGMPSHLKGSKYFSTAIMMAVRDDDYLDGITKVLYPAIAREYDVAVATIERAMRGALEVAWTTGDAEFQHELFGFTLRGNMTRPTNLEFMYRITDYIKLNS